MPSLSPKSALYKGVYEGNETERDHAYHQGSVSPWLIAHFADAYLKLHGKSRLKFIEDLYQGFEEDMYDYGVSTISELYDGNPPYRSGGAISQAWSVAEILRMKSIIDSYKK